MSFYHVVVKKREREGKKKSEENSEMCENAAKREGKVEKEERSCMYVVHAAHAYILSIYEKLLQKKDWVGFLETSENMCICWVFLFFFFVPL
ncbi:MAG: hypothetical protein Devi2KO_39460 [Devosia indica]